MSSFSNCDDCGLPIHSIPLECDGVCFRKFHPECSPGPRRSSRTNPTHSFTCSSCIDIKPCHALRACHIITTDLSLISDKLSSILQKLSSVENSIDTITSDHEQLTTRLDSLTDDVHVLSSASDKISDTTYRNLNLTRNLLDTISEVNLSPDLLPIREEISALHISCRRLGDVLSDIRRPLSSYPHNVPITTPASDPLSTTNKSSLPSDPPAILSPIRDSSYHSPTLASALSNIPGPALGATPSAPIDPPAPNPQHFPHLHTSLPHLLYGFPLIPHRLLPTSPTLLIIPPLHPLFHLFPLTHLPQTSTLLPLSPPPYSLHVLNGSLMMSQLGPHSMLADARSILQQMT